MLPDNEQTSDLIQSMDQSDPWVLMQLWDSFLEFLNAIFTYITFS